MAQTYSCSDESGTTIWNVERLWELAKTLPVKSVPVEQFASLFDSVCWFCEDDLPTFRAVVNHARRINSVDFTYPIILSAEGKVMDGMHRLAKAVLLGKTEIDAVQFLENPQCDQIILNSSSSGF